MANKSIEYMEIAPQIVERLKNEIITQQAVE